MAGKQVNENVPFVRATEFRTYLAQINYMVINATCKLSTVITNAFSFILDSWTLTRVQECIKTNENKLGVGNGSTQNIIRVFPNDTFVVCGFGIVNHLNYQNIHPRLQQLLRLLAANVTRIVYQKEGAASPASTLTTTASSASFSITNHSIAIRQESVSVSIFDIESSRDEQQWKLIAISIRHFLESFVFTVCFIDNSVFVQSSIIFQQSKA